MKGLMLFEPCTLKGRSLKNRIVFPPAVCFGWSSAGEMTDRHLEHYKNVAAGGVGFIITEASCISPDARLTPSQLGIWSDEFIQGFARLGERCHAEGVPVIAQIHHAGYKSVSGTPVVPSAVPKDEKGARTLDREDMATIKNGFVDAAVRIKKAGIDGVELHGAHGFLLSYFLSPVTNRRTDEYGGSVENRARIIMEIMEAIRAACGDDFIIGIRYGANPILEEGIAYSKLFEQAGCDLLHLSTGALGQDQIPAPPEYADFTSPVYTAIEIKKQVSIPVIAANSVGTLERGKRLVDGGMVDFAAYAKNILADYNWVKKSIAGGEVRGCFRCDHCRWFTRALVDCPARNYSAKTDPKSMSRP